MSTYDNGDVYTDASSGDYCEYVCISEGGVCSEEDDCHQMYGGGNITDFCCAFVQDQESLEVKES